VWPEPFGLVGLEAGALGVPAIANDVGGIREWLRDGENGIAVRSPATPASFGDALAAVLGDQDRLAMLGRGAREVAKAMTLDAHVDRLEAIFHGIA
jgi:glycosyltransferase involved in cell wall biosynthesis